MEAEVIDKIVSLRNEGYVHEIDGITHSAANLKPVVFEPMPDVLQVKTLQGFVDFIISNIDELNYHGLMVNVIDHEEVHLVSKIEGRLKRRAIFLAARLDQYQTFKFGEFLSTEAFIISVRSLFEPTTDLARVIEYASKMVAGTTVETDDDGITQVTTIKKGASGATKKSESSPTEVYLKPFRTFRDIEQPASAFLFRVRPGADGEAPRCALFESDGGRWKDTARKAIAEFIMEKVGGSLTILT